MHCTTNTEPTNTKHMRKNIVYTAYDWKTYLLIFYFSYFSIKIKIENREYKTFNPSDLFVLSAFMLVSEKRSLFEHALNVFFFLSKNTEKFNGIFERGTISTLFYFVFFLLHNPIIHHLYYKIIFIVTLTFCTAVENLKSSAMFITS